MAARDEAQSILDRCGPDTPREEIVWAAGVMVCDLAFYFEQLPVFGDRKTWPGGGCNLQGGRMLHCDRAGVHIHSSMLTGSPDVVPPVRYAEIGELVTLDRIGIDLHRRILRAMEAQEAHTDPVVPIAQRGSWDELLAESKALAEQVWQRCWPGPPVQLDLDLVHLMGVPS